MLRYRVKHAIYGDIGTYSNTVDQTGDVTTVLTEAHFKVSLLGIVVHREDAIMPILLATGRKPLLRCRRGATTLC